MVLEKLICRCVVLRKTNFNNLRNLEIVKNCLKKSTRNGTNHIISTYLKTLGISQLKSSFFQVQPDYQIVRVCIFKLEVTWPWSFVHHGAHSHGAMCTVVYKI